ncbi:MAG: hypothetical protein AAF518_21680 [Spirochaetota bacterium]
MYARNKPVTSRKIRENGKPVLVKTIHDKERGCITILANKDTKAYNYKEKSIWRNSLQETISTKLAKKKNF